MLTIKEIQDALLKSGAEWEVRETTAWRRGAVAGEDSGLFGLRLSDTSTSLRAASDSDFDELLASKPPARVDWHERGFVHPSRDQGACGACVAFATIAAIESRNWIKNGSLLELSEAELFHCNGGSCEDGWGLASGLAAATGGVAELSVAPWTASRICRNAPAALKVTSYREHLSHDSRRRAVADGPVVAGMRVYRDFLAYGGGVYRHVAGEFVANHAVCVVGYDDQEGFWLVKNSWGADFGSEGLFKIAFGECAIDDNPFYSLAT